MGQNRAREVPIVMSALLFARALTTGLEEAKAKNWTVVDMKKDWKVIYPFEKQ